MTYTEKIVDVATGEEIIRPYTSKEVKELEESIIELGKEQEALEQKQILRAEVLKKLNLSAEEAAVLIG